MWRNLYKLLFPLSLALLLSGPPAVYGQELAFLDDGTQYLWPTDASPYLSSTFAETRSAHFHAGLDIRTWGTEGYRVYATRDGLLFRLSIGPSGYGKVIYLQHDDGSYSLYAHLNRFAPFIQDIADSIRMETYSFEMDRLLGDRGIRVSQGDVIGYTGSTGVGPPHLHFELRTPDNEPFNPLLTNLSVMDQLPPVFSSLAAEHFNGDSYRTNRIETHNRRRLDDGTFDFGTIRTDGPIGLAVDVYDRANNTTNAYAAYALTLVHEADTLFSSTVNSFSYSDASQMFIDRSYPLLAEMGQGFQRLYVVNGNTLPFYSQLKNNGIIDLPEGDHPLKIVATDYYGNESVAMVTLQVVDRQVPVNGSLAAVPAYPTPDRTDESLTGPGFNYRSSIRTVEPVYLAETEPVGNIPAYTRLTQGPLLELTGGNRSRSIKKRLIPGATRDLTLPDQSFRMIFPENALFDTLSLRVTFQVEDHGPVIHFSPGPVPLRNEAIVHLVLPDLFNMRSNSDLFASPYEQTGLYSWDRYRNRYKFLGSANGRYLSAKIGSLQTLVVRRDEVPPVTGTPGIRTNPGGKMVVRLSVLDEMSGIDYRRSSIVVNGEKGITEYDPEDNELIYYHPDFNPRTENDVLFRVIDYAGNVTERSVTVPWEG